jgi:hypothetical protein
MAEQKGGPACGFADRPVPSPQLFKALPRVVAAHCAQAFDHASYDQLVADLSASFKGTLSLWGFDLAKEPGRLMSQAWHLRVVHQDPLEVADSAFVYPLPEQGEGEWTVEWTPVFKYHGP